MNSTARHAAFLSKLFNGFNKEKVVYCLLRNYEQLPEAVGNDVDIWVKDSDVARLSAIIKSTALNMGWELLEYAQRSSSVGDGDYFLVNLNSETVIIHLDVWTNIYWKGISFIDEGVFPENIKWFENGFYIASPGLQASMMLLKSLIYFGRIDEKYKEKIARYSTLDAAAFQAALLKPFGYIIANSVLQNAQSSEWVKIERQVLKLRIVLLLRAILLQRGHQLCLWGRYLVNRVTKYLFPRRGVFLVFIGPDGSGKTTLAELLFKSTVKKLFQTITYSHGRLPCLPELKSFLFWKSQDARRFSGPKVMEPFNALKAVVYPIYYGFNHFLSHVFVWKERARGGLVVFDRYFYDYLLLNQFSNCPRWIISVIAKLIPRPDAVIYLKCSPQLIHDRKPELPVAEIGRQQAICDSMIDKFSKTYVVETSEGIDSTVIKLENIIIELIRNNQQ